MASPLPISLRAWPSTEIPQLSLPSLISRINEQRGSFRNVSESALEEEIRVAQTGEGTSEDLTKATEVHSAEEIKSRRDVVAESREEILKQVAKAHMESAHALDFVSLLLSKHTPRQAELTLSPYLKQNLPMGSLEAQVLQMPQKTDNESVQEEKTPLGWKINALTSTADSLLRSASRLEQEVEQETKYWGQVLAVKEQGWPICRLPREKHTLGVRYGFAEAHSDYRDRGLAALRRDEQGNINLDCGSGSAGNRVLRVSLVRQKLPIMSSVKGLERTSEEIPVETRLLRARNGIYDEELYHELHREARNLTNHGVQSIDGKVSIPYEDDTYIEIDLMPSTYDGDLQTEKNICAGIAISLRVLLSHAHRQNLRRRVQPPPPMREGKMPRPTYAILTPVLEHVQHDLQLKAITRLLEDLRDLCLKVGFRFRFHQASNIYGLDDLEVQTTHDDLHATEILINQLTKPRHSSIVVGLPTGLAEIKVEIQTSLQPHVCGTAYQCTVLNSAPESFIARMQPVIQFSFFDELQNHILHLLKLDIVGLLASQPSAAKGWTIVSPHDGQLSRVHRSPEQTDKICISVQKKSIRLDWKRCQRKRNDEGTVWWDSATLAANGEQNRSFSATIEEIFGD